MTRGSPSVLGRVIALFAVALVAAAVVLALTPRRWQSTARLVAATDDFDAGQTLTVVRSGATLSKLVDDPDLLAALGVTPGQGAAPAMSLILSRRLTTVAGDSEVWVAVRDRDGDRAQVLATAIVEAAAVVELESRGRLLDERGRSLGGEAAARRARLEELVASRPDAGAGVAEEVWQARLREAASRLADAEEDLLDTRHRAANLRLPWIALDPPRPFQHAVPRRLGPAVAAAVAAPLLLVCVAMLVTGRNPGS